MRKSFNFGPNKLVKKDTVSTWKLMEIVASLHDGGWRSTDRSQLIDEYDLTDKEADLIIAGLLFYE